MMRLKLSLHNLAHEGPRRLPAPILRYAAMRGQQDHDSGCNISYCYWRVWKGLQLSKINLQNDIQESVKKIIKYSIVF